MMKCKNCGAELQIANGTYLCPYCGSSFCREELFPGSTAQNSSFRIIGGVLERYAGSETEAVIPHGVVSVGKEAFKDNLTVKKIVFSETVTSVADRAFAGCVNLIQIEGYENVVSFGEDCFRGAGLISVTVGENVQFLGKGCFSRMPKLETVTYNVERDLKLNHTFAYCPCLTEVKEERLHFFPSFHKSKEVLNNPNNRRPTFGDAFVGTPYIEATLNGKYREQYQKGTCSECGGKVKKGLFHAKCEQCGIDYKN